MRKINKFMSIVVLACVALLAGCNNADYDTISTPVSVYLASAAGTSRSELVELSTEGADITITIRLSKLMDVDVPVTIFVDPIKMQEYNDFFGSSYYPVPPVLTNIDPEEVLVIPAGEIGVVKRIHIRNFDSDNKTWALPVSVRSQNPNVVISDTQHTFVYIMAKRINDWVPQFRYLSGATPMKAKPTLEDAPKGWDLNMDQWTIECWTRMSGFNINNQAFFSIVGGNDPTYGDYSIYIRFGDANRPFNYIQWKAWGVQLTGPTDLVANRWYHWAFQYDGTNILIYRDGQEYLRMGAPHPGVPWRIETIDMISSHSQYSDVLNMSQVKIWSRALTPAQISSNMYYEVDPDSPGLVAYWKMNEGPDNFNYIFNDATGNGHDIIVPRDRIMYSTPWIGPMGYDN